MPLHENRMLRHPLVFRAVQVVQTRRLTPHMQRIVLGGPELQGFHSAAPDDHVKLFFPNANGELVVPTLGVNGIEFPPGVAPPPMRDYTPLHHDTARNELTIDFALHGDGHAASWAVQAAPGDHLGVGGPRGSFMVAEDFDAYALVGDETALPAITRWLARMPAGMPVRALIEIPDNEDRQPLPGQARLDVTWLPRDGIAAADSRLLEQALRELEPPTDDTFYWIAAESRRARAMRQYLGGERGVPKDWLRATGYWKHDPADRD